MHKRAQFGLAAAAGVAALFASPTTWFSSQEAGLTTQAQARVGRPLTPGSIAGVNRRVDRRTTRRAYYGTGAAIGTAAAVGAAGAYWGSQYYNNPYYGNSYYGAYPGQYYGTYPGQYSGAYTGQYYGTYPGQYFGTNSGYGTYTAQTTRPVSDSNYWGPAYYGPYAYAGMDQVQAQTTTGRTADWCASHYKSYSASTGTFLGKDGKRHPCP